MSVPNTVTLYLVQNLATQTFHISIYLRHFLNTRIAVAILNHILRSLKEMNSYKKIKDRAKQFDPNKDPRTENEKKRYDIEQKAKQKHVTNV